MVVIGQPMVVNGWQSLALAGNGRQLMLTQILKNWSLRYASDQLLNSVSFQISESHTKASENLLCFITFHMNSMESWITDPAPALDSTHVLK